MRSATPSGVRISSWAKRGKIPYPRDGRPHGRSCSAAAAPALRELEELVGRARSKGLRSRSGSELERLPLLYRHAATRLSQARTGGLDPAATAVLARVAGGAHALLYRDLDAPPVSRLRR